MTISEQLFDEYLKTREIKFDIERGNKVHPDRTLHLLSGNVVCEIRQLDIPNDYKFQSGVVNVGDPYKRLRRAIKKKVRQGAEAKLGNMPYVVILFNNDIRQPMQNFVLEAAMYGDLCFVIDIKPTKPRSESKLIGQGFAAGGIIRHARSYSEPGSIFNKRISAVAVLEIINPTYHWVSEACDDILGKTKELKQTLVLANKAISKLIKEGKYKPDLKVPRLRVFHNFYATNQLRFDIFDSKYDEQFYIDQLSGQIKRYQ